MSLLHSISKLVLRVIISQSDIFSITRLSNRGVCYLVRVCVRQRERERDRERESKREREIER